MSIVTAFRQRANEPQGYRKILRVGLPLIASMASSTVMLFTDRLFLSRYSVDAIAAALPASMASMTIFMTLMGVCGYTSVLIAQYVGSKAYTRVGSALWQGIWCSLAAGIILLFTCLPAEWLFTLAGHEPAIRKLEVVYFRILNAGAVFALLGATLSGFFSGQGRTRPVMVINMIAAMINVPLDYLFIFGGLGLPDMGIAGAGLATVTGWIFSASMLAYWIFKQPKNEKKYWVLRGRGFEPEMFKRLLRYGLPSGVNLFMEMIASAWFIFAIGAFGTVALAASNIAFSLNSLIFVPMIGLNIAVATLTGQAMGRGKPQDAERVTINTLHIALAYMMPLAIIMALFAGPLISIFAPGDLSPEEFLPVRELGVYFLYFIAIYSLVDAGNIVFLGGLKGAGDTLGIMYLLLAGLVFGMIVPIFVLQYVGLASPINYWLVFTAYVIGLACIACVRFYRRKWHSIRVVETAPGAQKN